MQKKLGPKEKGDVDKAINRISKYKVLKKDKKKKETFINHLLFRDLAQIEPRVTNANIHTVELNGERFRPEFFIKGSKNHPLFCVECKKLTDQTAKSRFKEGLSQALVYSTDYKCVLLVFYDFTKGSHYSVRSQKKNSSENKLIQKLWDMHRIKVLFVVPQ
jgi:hypothetical protein